VRATKASIAINRATRGEHDEIEVCDGTLMGFQPDWCIAPGHIIRDWCEDNDLTQARLALRADISQKHLSQIITGQATYSPELCVKIAKITGIGAEFLYRLQADWLIGKAMGKTEM
jgi:addiction module HigA family antidote